MTATQYRHRRPKLFAFAGRVALMVFGLIVLSIAGLILYGVHEPPPIPYFERRILTPTVKRGDILLVSYNFRRPNKCAAIVHRSIIDAGNKVIWEESEYRPPFLSETRFPRGDMPAIRQAPIVSVATPGLATYDVTIEWSCNPIQRIWPVIVEPPSMHFTILE